MTTRTIVRNGYVLDTATMSFSDSQDVVIEDGVIVDVVKSASANAEIDVDAAGKYVLPGLIDGHVHFRLASLDFRSMLLWGEVQFGIAMARLSEQTIARGFTTVRDLGGDVDGLIQAIERKMIIGPRIVHAGLMLSQTGGHGDAVGGHLDVPSCACALRSDHFSIVADGPEAIRKAARHNLRSGSDFLKMHVSGGVATPMDPLDSVQYTPEEIKVAVIEAQHRGTYVAAHAYIPESITMAVENGVLSIEHGNLIDAESARLLGSSDAIMIPTLVLYEALNEYGAKYGFPSKNLEKNKIIFEAGLTSVDLAVGAGVTLGLGTDLIGEIQKMQNHELVIRSEVQPVADVLRSMWCVNPKLCKMEGKIGVLNPGAFGDIVISRINPLEDIVGFADYERSMTHVLQGGAIVVER